MDATMAQTPWNVRPYYMHFVLDAIGHAGLFDKYGMNWMRDQALWNINPEMQTSQEMGNQGDLSHGWIATPLIQMSERILGVQPASPAYKTISVRPTLCDLQWTRGSVPTPHGRVSVSWKRAGDGLPLCVVVPPGTSADVAIPTTLAGAAITANGKGLWKGGQAARGVGISQVHQEPTAVMAHLAPGTYTFVGHGLGLAPAVNQGESIKRPLMTYARRTFLQRSAMLAAGLAAPARPLRADAAPVAADGKPFQPTNNSLKQYRTPAWFADAKFGGLQLALAALRAPIQSGLQGRDRILERPKSSTHTP